MEHSFLFVLNKNTCSCIIDFVREA
ncbi:hypothetical protein BU614_06155 [Staphylococcus capitis]|nr:hypothetical protein BU614_06155 [Staphylococcus capitis]